MESRVFGPATAMYASDNVLEDRMKAFLMVIFTVATGVAFAKSEAKLILPIKNSADLSLTQSLNMRISALDAGGEHLVEIECMTRNNQQNMLSVRVHNPTTGTVLYRLRLKTTESCSQGNLNEIVKAVNEGRANNLVIMLADGDIKLANK